MSYQEKRTITSMLSAAAVLAAYCIYAFAFHSDRITTDDLKFWAATILIFIIITVAAIIVIQIVFHIILAASVAIKQTLLNGEQDGKKIDRTIKASMTEDEMDKLIHLKSSRISVFFTCGGFVLSLFLLTLGSPVAVMLNIIFISLYVGSLAENFLSLHYYKKGISNG